MKKNLFFLLLFFLSFQTIAQEKQPYFLTSDELAITVVNLRKPLKSGHENTGTGSFITKDNKMYIVTATHVAKNMDSLAYVIIEDKKSLPVRLKLKELAPNIKWKNHPIADLSILELNPKKEIIDKYLQKRFIPFDIIDLSQVAMPRNTQLTIIGFPLGLGANGHFSPLTYRSYPSSSLITFNRADTNTPQTFIILENPSIGGYSGGPVYDLSIVQAGNVTMRGNGTKLHGFIHGTISDTTGGKLTAMVPAYYIKDLIK